jgi:ERCC4-type nuclease
MSELQKSILYFDTREPITKKGTFEKWGYVVEQVDLEKKLGIGDYYYKNDKYELVFERKTSDDFDASMADDSLFYQCEQMNKWLRQKTDRFAYVLFVGTTNHYNEFAKVMPVSRVGAIARIMAGYYPIPVTPLSDEFDLEWFIHKTIRCANEDKFGLYRPIDLFKYKHPDMNLKSNDPREVFINVFRIFGASKPQATKIVDELVIESVNDLILINYEDLVPIKGIGKQTAHKILDKLGI